MRFTKSQIMEIPHLEALGFEDAKNFKAIGVSTDTRTIRANELFVAIRGNQFDGHNFISKAIEAKAAAIVVDRRWAESNREMMVSVVIPRIVVENTAHALGYLARIIRLQYRIPFIAVGGSNGKTTTKEMIRSVLSKKYHVLCTEGNLNNHIGVPQTLFKLQPKHQVAVVELGTNHPGEISYLCTVLQPTHGLITNIGREHLEFFGSVEGVTKAEGELFKWLMEHNGTLFVNADDRNISNLSRKATKAIRYGFAARNVSVKGKIKALDTEARALVSIKLKGKKEFDIRIGVPGKHNAQNALAAAAIGTAFKVTNREIGNALGNFEPAAMRMQVQKTNNTIILNDAYNANPDSVLAALTTLHAMKSPGRKIVALADMLELGDQAEDLHRQIGTALIRFKIDDLLTFGPLSKCIYDAAPIPRKKHFESRQALIEHLLSILTGENIVLVKGSRGMKMDEVVAALLAHNSKKAGN